LLVRRGFDAFCRAEGVRIVSRSVEQTVSFRPLVCTHAAVQSAFVNGI